MKHLGEDEMIEVYYGEATGAANAHLEACPECSAQYATFKQSLDAIQPTAVPQRTADYGEHVWETLRPQLIPYQKKRTNWLGWTQWRAAARCYWQRCFSADDIGRGPRLRNLTSLRVFHPRSAWLWWFSQIILIAQRGCWCS